MSSRPESSSFRPHLELVPSVHEEVENEQSAAKRELKNRLREELAILGEEMSIQMSDFSDDILDVVLIAKSSPVHAIVTMERAKRVGKARGEILKAFRHFMVEIHRT